MLEYQRTKSHAQSMGGLLPQSEVSSHVSGGTRYEAPRTRRVALVLGRALAVNDHRRRPGSPHPLIIH